MQGFSSMLVEEVGTGLSERGKDFAKRIATSAQFMDSLLTDLLAFSRISQQRIELAPVDPNQVVQTVLFRNEREIQEKNARVEVDSEPWPQVRAHEPTLGQVLSNLLTNALKFVEAGVTPQVRIRAEARTEPAADQPPAVWVRIWVEDNGI